jgi:nanoRNase/pAp phosphatase (c-di-AMP/oligoRNAs hydrolase)
MTKLSLLPNADAVSRTDNTQDVNNAFNTATRRLADAQALHTSLLKQLAAAVTTEQVDSLHAQIRDNERTIAGDESALAILKHRISFSSISLTINARTQAAGGGGHSGGGGFTLRKAAHDAGRVLVVVAGVVLIALAVLIPIGLVLALAWWIGALLTHRRRERALDLA